MRALKVASVGACGPVWPMRESQEPGPEVSSAIKLSPLGDERGEGAEIDLPHPSGPACSPILPRPSRRIDTIDWGDRVGLEPGGSIAIPRTSASGVSASPLRGPGE